MTQYASDAHYSFADKVNRYIEKNHPTRKGIDNKAEGNIKEFYQELKQHFIDSPTQQDLIGYTPSADGFVSYQSFCPYITGTTPPPIGVLIAVAEKMGCSTDYLLGLTENNSLDNLSEQCAPAMGLDTDTLRYLINARIASKYPYETINVYEENDEEIWQYVFQNPDGKRRTYDELSEVAKDRGLDRFTPRHSKALQGEDYGKLMDLLLAPMPGESESIAEMILRYARAYDNRRQDELLGRLVRTGSEPDEELLTVQRAMEKLAKIYTMQHSKRTHQLSDALKNGIIKKEYEFYDWATEDYVATEELTSKRLQSRNDEQDLTQREFKMRTGILHPERLPLDERYAPHKAKYPKAGGEYPLENFSSEGWFMPDETAKLYRLLEEEGMDWELFQESEYLSDDPEYLDSEKPYTASRLQQLIDKYQFLLEAREKIEAETIAAYEAMLDETREPLAEIKEVHPEPDESFEDEEAEQFENIEEEPTYLNYNSDVYEKYVEEFLSKPEQKK